MARLGFSRGLGWAIAGRSCLHLTIRDARMCVYMNNELYRLVTCWKRIQSTMPLGTESHVDGLYSSCLIPLDEVTWFSDEGGDARVIEQHMVFR